MPLHNWDSVQKEQLNPLVARKAIHTETMTVARLFLAKGAVVPEHSHANEQFTTVVEGRLRFVVAGVEHVLEAGMMMQVPPGARHRVEAIEDCVALDIFSPRREDWIRGDDAYLRK
jgi:quercetin dioxygenase-like cupin family protein